MSYASIDGLESKAQDAHIEDSLKIQKLKMGENKNDSGICEDCGKPIPEARLKRIPNANCCVPCQESREKESDSMFTYKNPYIP